MGCHTCWLSHFTLVCLWCGRTVTWLPNFLGWVDYHISLAMGLCPRARFARGWSSAIIDGTRQSRWSAWRSSSENLFCIWIIKEPIQEEGYQQSSWNGRLDWNLNYNLWYYFWYEKGMDMGNQTSLKTSQRGCCNPLNPPPPWIRQCCGLFIWVFDEESVATVVSSTAVFVRTFMQAFTAE